MTATTTTGDASSTFDNGRRGAVNAWFFDRCAGLINFVLRAHKREAFGDIARGDIVEIGAGTGANFAFFPAGSRVLAVEPNAAMYDRLLERAARAGVDLELVAAPAEAIPLPDGSVDEVVASLVLCTVDDPDRVLAEVRRILRPGGRFRYVEHVVAHRWSPRRWLQALVSRPWAWAFEGCDLRRDTATTIRRAGFSEVSTTARRMQQSLFVPANSAIYGVAVK